MSSSGPGDEQQPPQWQQPQWQQPQQDQPSWQQPQQEQQQWGGSPQWGQQQQWGQSPQTPGSATAALILGICALVLCPIVCGPLAIVYGNKAKNEINTSGGRLTGGGLATAGIVLGWIGVAWAVIVILLVIAAIAGSS